MKNFAQMSTKKLNNLLADAATTPEEKEAIEKVIAERTEATTGGASTIELTAEEQSAIEAAEGPAKATAKKSAKPAKERMSDEERAALVEKLKAEILNHKCQVVPFNTVEWVDGFVRGVIDEKRSSRVLVAIETSDGRRIVKTHDSPLYKVLDEVVEPVKKSRAAKSVDKDGNPIVKTPWTDEDVEAAISAVIEHVGKMVSFPEAGAYGVVEEGAQTVTGRIVSLVPDKRAKSILYRIEVTLEDGTTKNVHKTAGNSQLEIAEKHDEAGAEIYGNFVDRRQKRLSKEPAVKQTPKEIYDNAEIQLNKALENLEKAKALVEKRQAAFDAAKEALAAAEATPETTEATEETTDDML